ncbi:MAG TPA: alpha/beta hydrolase [Mycobacteriales bacterium]|nr:alpha/beta hydrolase [Mycobacteriales bacterium]
MEASDGTRLAYEVEGQGPPLVLHLGAGCDSRLWRAAGYVKPLAHSYSCILFDHRGHGLSDNPRGAVNYHLDRLTADVVELLDLLGFASTAFWGYSSGISPGVRLAERFPDRVWALVASGSVGPPDTPEDLAAWSASSAAEFREHGWDKLIARFEAQEPEPIPEWMTASIRETDVGQFIDLIESYVDWHWEEWDALPALKAPVLFLTGELEDEDDDVGRIIKTMRHGELLRMAGFGHINAFLNTATVLPRVQSFLAAHTPRL